MANLIVFSWILIPFLLLQPGKFGNLLNMRYDLLIQIAYYLQDLQQSVSQRDLFFMVISTKGMNKIIWDN